MKTALLIAALAASTAFAQEPSKKANEKPAPATQTEKVKEETTPQTDHVCGMTIDPKTAEGKFAYKGKMYYFCSREDQQAFSKEPDKYLAKK